MAKMIRPMPLFLNIYPTWHLNNHAARGIRNLAGTRHPLSTPSHTPHPYRGNIDMCLLSYLLVCLQYCPGTPCRRGVHISIISTDYLGSISQGADGLRSTGLWHLFPLPTMRTEFSTCTVHPAQNTAYQTSTLSKGV